MGRWSHLDTDEERLPEGMTRIGYDADTQIYTFRDSDGSTWESAPGNQYGKLFRVKTPPAAPSPRDTFSFPLGHGIEEEDDDYRLHDPDEPTDSDDDSTLAAKLGIVPPEKAKLASGAHSTSNKQPRHASKPLPSLPREDGEERKDDDSPPPPYCSDDDIGKPAPQGEEHRHRREMNRKQDRTLKRASTISRITNYLRRPSASGPPSPAGAWVRRSATVRDGQGPPEREGSRRRATTFDEMLGPQDD